MKIYLILIKHYPCNISCKNRHNLVFGSWVQSQKQALNTDAKSLLFLRPNCASLVKEKARNNKMWRLQICYTNMETINSI